jgi:Holliday junction DNA helicase RuvA
MNMITSLHGKLETIHSDSITLNVGGVGFLVYMSSADIASLGLIGNEMSIQTQLIWKDDGPLLCGFTSKVGLELFRNLICVTGLGPRLALGMLSAMDASQLAIAIASSNTELLISIPGIGRKMAQRIILELKDRISTGFLSEPTINISDENQEVMAALIALGFSASEASRAIASNTVSTSVTFEDKIRSALNWLSQKNN